MTSPRQGDPTTLPKTADAQQLLAQFDSQIRGDVESAISRRWKRFGNVWAAQFPSWFLTAGPGHSLQLADLRRDTREALAWIKTQPAATLPTLEWKTYGHHTSLDLERHLAELGLVAEVEETLMAGPARALIEAGTQVDGVTVRQVVDDSRLVADCSGATQLLNSVFGEGSGPTAEELQVKALDQGGALYLAETGGEVIGVGRVILDGDTGWAGLWGGCVASNWRSRGVYRALVRARAIWAQNHEATVLRSDCMPMSQPILERAGLKALTSTTPHSGTLETATAIHPTTPSASANYPKPASRRPGHNT